MSGENQNNKNLLLMIIILASVIIIGLVITVIVLVTSRGNKTPEIAKRNVVVNSSNAEKIVDEMALAEYIEPGYYNASMTNVWHFATGDAISEDAFVENVKENTNDVYFDVFLASDETVPILSSPLLPRGSKLDNIALDTPLSAGTYDCILIYHLVDDEQKPVSSLRIAITVIVEK